MSVSSLTREQETFLEECALEFSDRFTDADLEFKKICEMGTPKPPIMCPWFTRGRYNNRDRDRGESRYNDRRDHHSDNYNKERSSYYNRDRRYRPY